LTPGEISLLKNMHKKPSDVFSASVRRDNLIVEGAVKENEYVSARDETYFSCNLFVA
jgi:hypothetical protein